MRQDFPKHIVIFAWKWRVFLHFHGGHEHFTDWLLRTIVMVTPYLNIDGGTLLNSCIGVDGCYRLTGLDNMRRGILMVAMFLAPDGGQ